MSVRSDRQDAVREIVRSKPIRTQSELAKELNRRGFTCTQTTVSRYVAKMGLQKLPDGMYVLAEDIHLQRVVSEFLIGVESVNNLVVMNTRPDSGPAVAAAVDAARFDSVLGSLSGNSFVVSVTRTNGNAENMSRLIARLRGVE